MAYVYLLLIFCGFILGAVDSSDPTMFIWSKIAAISCFVIVMIGVYIQREER